MLHHMVGLREACCHVTETYPAAVVVLVNKVVGAVLFEALECGVQRLLNVEHGGQVFVFDHDPLGPLGGCLRRLGQHGADLLALEQHAILSQHRLIIGADTDQFQDRVPVVGDVLISEYAHDALDGHGWCGVKFCDQGMVPR